MLKKLVLLLAVVALVAAFVGGATARSGWKWHYAAGDPATISPDGFTWDPGAEE